MSNLPDAEASARWMEALAQGSDAALDPLIAAWEAPLHRFIHRYVQEDTAAGDLTQETFVRIYQNRARYRAGTVFAPWAFTIAANLCRNHRRWRWRQRTESLDGDDAHDSSRPHASAAAGPDEQLVSVETSRAVLAAIEALPPDQRVTVLLFEFDELSYRLPLMASVTFIQKGSNRGVTGQTVEAFWNSISHVPLLSVGMNCALGPKEMRPLIEELSQIAPIYISCYPNAGLPDPLLPTGFPETPETLAPQLQEWAQSGWLNMVGGCCGTTPPHIKAIHDAVSMVIKRMNAIPGRKAILFFSDGTLGYNQEITMNLGSGSLISERKIEQFEKSDEASTAREAEESDQPIYTLVYDTLSDVVKNDLPPWDRGGWKKLNARMRAEHRAGAEYMLMLAKKSGARGYAANDARGLDQLFTEIADEISQQYTLGYYPKDQSLNGTTHGIKVTVDRSDVEVRARSSYVRARPKK